MAQARRVTRCGRAVVKCTRSPACGRNAVWRLSVPADPWPLQYGCDLHVLSLALDLGGDVRLTRLEPGQTTPAARPINPIRLPGEEPIPVELTTCPASNTTASQPRVTVTCEFGDTSDAHRRGIHIRNLGDRVIRWPVTAFDHRRWREQ